jgi:DNA-binding protein H-NS
MTINNKDIRKQIKKMQKNIKQMKEAIALLQVIVKLTKTAHTQALVYERLKAQQETYQKITNSIINVAKFVKGDKK